jgi:hypothetical protein
MGSDHREDTKNRALTLAKRSSVNFLGEVLKAGVESGRLVNAMPQCTVRHHFAPAIEPYGCGTYARELTMPVGAVIVGKIHRHSHITILSKGHVIVVSEDGREDIKAPHTFLSPVGAKRAFYVVEEAVLTTIHLTRHTNADAMEDIEAEVITPDYTSIGLEEPNFEKFEEELMKLEF